MYCLLINRWLARSESQRLASTIPSNTNLVDASTWNKNGKPAADQFSQKSSYELHTMDKISGIRLIIYRVISCFKL